MPKKASRENGEQTYRDVVKARGRSNTTVVVKKDGTTASIDKKDAAKLVSGAIKDRLHEDIHTLFDNYLLKHVPLELAKLLKEACITHSDGAAFLPHELIVMWKGAVSDDPSPFACEKGAIMSTLEAAFKGYMKKYVETIVAKI